MSWVLPKGTPITCTNGHIVGVTTRDLRKGDMDYASAFEWLQDDQPRIGEFHVPRCNACGAEFIRGQMWVHTPQGWQPPQDDGIALVSIEHPRPKGFWARLFSWWWTRHDLNPNALETREIDL